MINSRKLLLQYIFSDFIAACIAWFLFIATRFLLTREKLHQQNIFTLWDYLNIGNVKAGFLFAVVLMLFVFYLSGYYNTQFFKSRLQELTTTFLSSFAVSLLLFFIILINDSFPERLKNYELVATMWGIIFCVVYIFRAIITSRITKKIHNGEIQFNTLIIGGNAKAFVFADNLKKANKSSGYKIVGFVCLPEENVEIQSYNGIPVYKSTELPKICTENNIQTFIIVPDKQDKPAILNTINGLFKYGIPIKIAPELYDIIISRIRHANIIGEPLVNIAQGNMSDCQKNIKRLADIIFSTLALLILLPFFLLIAILIKRDSKGPVIYKQERIGKHGHPFYIYKFRTMSNNAEQGNIPQLSSENDTRITAVGRILRKYRIDEIPQFWNVLKGDMSIVGPRPERKYFADQIIEKAPFYALSYQIRPGITSWGMVKFGYATNVNAMIERAKYDLIYIENMSLLIDLKIIAYTIRTVFTGKGM